LPTKISCPAYQQKKFNSFSDIPLGCRAPLENDFSVAAKKSRTIRFKVLNRNWKRHYQTQCFGQTQWQPSCCKRGTLCLPTPCCVEMGKAGTVLKSLHSNVSSVGPVTVTLPKLYGTKQQDPTSCSCCSTTAAIFPAALLLRSPSPGLCSSGSTKECALTSDHAPNVVWHLITEENVGSNGPFSFSN
jgi:hypothetical protein